MTQPEVKNLAASVKARLANIARDQKEDFQELLSRYGRERLLYRLSVSEYKERFVLKGALLFAYWTGAPHRPTRDMDLLGHGASEIAPLEEVFRDLCKIEVEPDGLEFQPDLGILNTRMKDFFDVWSASQEFAFDGPTLCKAVKTTFETRGTKVPKEPPLALTAEFYDDRQKNAQWKAFLNKAKLNAEGKSLPEIAAALRKFLMPVSAAVARSEIHQHTWRPGGPWT